MFDQPVPPTETISPVKKKRKLFIISLIIILLLILGVIGLLVLNKIVPDNSGDYIPFGNGFKLINIDKDTYKLLKKTGDYVFIKDKNGVYFLSNPNQPAPICMGPDYPTAGHNSAYCTDKIGAYKIDGLDGPTFELLSGNSDIGRDKNGVYSGISGYNIKYDRSKGNLNLNYTKMDNVDTKNLEAINWFFSRDGNNIYFLGEILPEADYDTFQVLNREYAKDKNTAYYYGSIPIKKISPIDYDSFQVLEGSYAKDNYHMYYSGEIKDQ